MAKTILVVDDEKNIRELIKFNLEAENYRVILAADGIAGMEQLSENIDLVVLDLMLPGMDGLTFCRKVRSENKYKNIPIIMLTAKSEEVDKILGLEMGADDYITKPFNPRELIARIKAIFRRINSLKQEDISGQKKDKLIEKGSIKMDIESHEIKKDGENINLAPKEFELLRYFIINTNKVLTRDLLLDKIWGYQYSGDTRTVDVHVRRIRKKIGDEYIKTVRGVGYKFVPVE
ncbi:MAG: response regulator [Bacillota bacterium]